jgi:long-subunit fatty acid transport protein
LRAVVWLLVGCATVVHANPFELSGFDARSAGDAEASAPTSAEPSAVFYNPAGIVQSPRFRFLVSGWAMGFQSSVVSQDPAKALDCAWCTPTTQGGMTLAFQFPFGGKLYDRLAVGVGLHLPSGPLAQVATADPNRPAWFLIDQRGHVGIYAGVGLKLADKLSIGVGAQVLADLRGNGVDLQLSPFSKSVKYRQVDSDLTASVAPTAGLWYAPTPAIKLGFSYRSEMSLFYVIPASIELEGVANMGFEVSGLKYFTPHTLELGGTWAVTDALTLALSGQYALWSRAPDPYVRVKLDLEGETLQALGLGDALDLFSDEMDPGFANTLSGRIGANWQILDWFNLRLGAAYRPTPVPKQDAAGTNLLDGGHVVGALGVGFKFRDPAQWFENRLEVDLAAHGILVLPRQARKESTDTVPSYAYRAMGGSVGLQFSYSY